MAAGPTELHCQARLTHSIPSLHHLLSCFHTRLPKPALAVPTHSAPALPGHFQAGCAPAQPGRASNDGPTISSAASTLDLVLPPQSHTAYLAASRLHLLPPPPTHTCTPAALGLQSMTQLILTSFPSPTTRRLGQSRPSFRQRV